jgi:hypothetical protein
MLLESPGAAQIDNPDAALKRMRNQVPRLFVRSSKEEELYSGILDMLPAKWHNKILGISRTQKVGLKIYQGLVALSITRTLFGSAIKA